MKYKEVKRHCKSGQLEYHYFVDENGNKGGEYQSFCDHGQLNWHHFTHRGYDYGEVKTFNDDGTIFHHYLMDGKGNELADVIAHCKPSTHTEEQLIKIAKRHNLPPLSELPKTEAELTLWNLKWPDCPCLPIKSK